MDNLTESLETGVSLVGMKNCLTLIQTAYAMVLEGVTRATATQVANREASEFSNNVTPSNVGQVFAALKIKTVISHGKTRFVLNIKELERIRETIVAYCEELAQKLEASLKSYEELDARVKALVARLQEVCQLSDQEKELMRQIEEV